MSSFGIFSALYHQSNVNFFHGGLKGFIITQTLLLIYKGNKDKMPSFKEALKQRVRLKNNTSGSIFQPKSLKELSFQKTLNLVSPLECYFKSQSISAVLTADKSFSIMNVN